MANYNNATIRVQFGDGVDDMRHQRFAAQFVKWLWASRTHAGSLTSGEDNYTKGRRHGHPSFLVGRGHRHTVAREAHYFSFLSVDKEQSSVYPICEHPHTYDFQRPHQVLRLRQLHHYAHRLIGKIWICVNFTAPSRIEPVGPFILVGNKKRDFEPRTAKVLREAFLPWRVVQLAERLTLNQEVAGSSPAPPTTLIICR